MKRKNNEKAAVWQRGCHHQGMTFSIPMIVFMVTVALVITLAVNPPSAWVRWNKSDLDQLER